MDVTTNNLSRRALLRNSLITAAVAGVPAFALAQQKPGPAATTAAPSAPASANPQVDDLKKAFAASHAYTVDMANTMPEEKYHFKPVPLDEIRTFGQQMVHIGEALTGIYQHFVEQKKTPPPSEAAKEQFTSKADVIAKLDAAYNYVEAAVAKLTDADLDKPTPFFGHSEVPARHVMRTLLDHSTHHRAQTVVYLRLNGIKPATYRS
jgi:uncharacterized damage-inducible protein DinB